MSRLPGASFAGGFVGAAFQGATSGVLEPALRVVAYGTNAQLPTLVPDISSLLHAQLKGLIPEPLFKVGMRANGAYEDNGSTASTGFGLWQHIINSAYVEYDLHSLWRLFVRGKITGADMEAGIRRLGYGRPGQVQTVASLLTLPPTGIDLLRLWRRGVYDDDTVVKHLMETQNLQFEDATAIRDNSDYVPGPGDLVLFMTRDVDDPAIVAAGQLDLEFPEKFAGAVKRWAAWSGISEEVMRRYWRAHWQYPAPGQLYEMLHRLRPNRIQNLPLELQQVKPVTIEEIVKTLGIVDYAPAWRERLAAISYRTLTIRDIRQALEYGTADEGDAVEYLLDLGSSPDDARRLARAYARFARRQRVNRAIAASKGAVFSEYRDGAIDREQVRARLEALDLDEEQVAIALARMDDELLKTLTGDALKTARAMFLSGEWNAEAVRVMLRDVPVADEAINYHLARWKFALQRGRRQLATGQILDYTRQGILDVAHATQRLVNLGYDDVAVQTMLERVAQLARADQAKRLAAFLAAQRKAAREARAALLFSAGKGQIVRWVKEGILSPQSGIDRLVELGVSPDDARRYIQEALTPHAGPGKTPPAPKPPPRCPAKPCATPRPRVTTPGGQSIVAHQPTAAVVCRWYRRGIIDEAGFRQHMANLGYEESDIDSSERDCRPGQG